MSRERTSCQARQFSDQMMCGRCGLQWDVKDPEPPRCPLESGRSVTRSSAPSTMKGPDNA